MDWLLGTLKLVGLAYSFKATLGGLLGLGLIALAVFGLALLPPLVSAFVPAILKRALVLFGVAFLVASICFQVGLGKGVARATRAAVDKAVAAEAERARIAEKTAADIAAQATADLAAEHEAIRKLKELNDALRADAGRDRPCLDRGTARRLRDL